MIAVDAMGGDSAPIAVLKGVIRAAKNGVPILLSGPQKRLEEELLKLGVSYKSLPLSFIDAPEIIAMGDEPVQACRKKQNSSLVRAVACVKKHATAVVSAGNSGALMAAATFILGRKKGIERPAIAGLIPAKKEFVLTLDLGANADCKPSYLLGFAQLGDEYVRTVLKNPSPKIGLLSNGSEKGKGSQLIRDAGKLLEQSSYNFLGNVEPQDIVENKVDVVVCDGFSGNILLKTMEATASYIASNSKEMMTFVDTKFKQGGALLLGVNGVVIVAHGSADEYEIEKAIMLAWNASQAKHIII